MSGKLAVNIIAAAVLARAYAPPNEVAEHVVSKLSEYGYSIVEALCKCGHRSGVHTEMHRSCSVELGTWICPCEEDTND